MFYNGFLISFVFFEWYVIFCEDFNYFKIYFLNVLIYIFMKIYIDSLECIIIVIGIENLIVKIVFLWNLYFRVVI